MNIISYLYKICHILSLSIRFFLSPAVEAYIRRTVFITKQKGKGPRLSSSVFDGNPEVMIAIGCVTNDRLRESPPPGKCKHNVLVVFDC